MNAKGLQLLELILAMVILSFILVATNVMIQGAGGRTREIRLHGEAGEQLDYAFRRIGDIIEDIQPGQMINTATPVGITLPGASNIATIKPPFSTVQAFATDSNAANYWAPGGKTISYLVITNHTANSGAAKPYETIWVGYRPLAGTDPVTPITPVGDGVLEYYNDGGTGVWNQVYQKEALITGGVFPYARILDYDGDTNCSISCNVDPVTNIDGDDKKLIEDCIGAWTAAACKNPKAGSPYAYVYPVFELSPDKKQIFVSLRTGRKIGDKMVYSKPVTRAFWVRGEQSKDS